MKTAVVDFESNRYEAAKLAEKFSGFEESIMSHAAEQYDYWAKSANVSDPEDGLAEIEGQGASGLVGENTMNSVYEKAEQWQTEAAINEERRDRVARLLRLHGIQSLLYLKEEDGYYEYILK
jgi:hypothetical protein